ncbi:MAG: hypothetical protein ACI4MJ_06180, partial [Aristaeellaceae bacterium]
GSSRFILRSITFREEPKNVSFQADDEVRPRRKWQVPWTATGTTSSVLTPLAHHPKQGKAFRWTCCVVKHPVLYEQ